jgi:tRNA pseudouridine38-40 synthase
VTVLRLDLEYDGAAFYGWAAQPGLRTVEGVLTEALRVFWPHGGRPAVAGRTDTGVHASAQVVTVDAAGCGP